MKNGKLVYVVGLLACIALPLLFWVSNFSPTPSTNPVKNDIRRTKQRIKLQWIHFPKVGTSFLTTVYRAQCPRLPNEALPGCRHCLRRTGYAPLELDALVAAVRHASSCSAAQWHRPAAGGGAGAAAGGCGSLEQNMLHMWPPEHYCDASVLRNSTGRPSMTALGRCIGHFALPPSPRAAQLPPALRDVGAASLAMFRAPRARLASALADNVLLEGMSNAARARLMHAANHSFRAMVLAAPHSLFHCQTRMLAGESCHMAPEVATAPAINGTFSKAIDAIQNRLIFVGLVERWPQSICLAHAVFDLPLDARSTYAAIQNVRRTRHPPRLRAAQDAVMRAALQLESDSGGSAVDADLALYDEARRRFERDVQQHKHAVQVCLQNLQEIGAIPK